MMHVKDYTLNVPLPLAVARGQAATADGHALHLRVEDTDALVKANDAIPWQRVWEITGPTIEDFALLTAYHDRARWNLWWKGFDVGRLLDLAPSLRRRTVTVLVAPDDPNLHEKLLLGDSLSLRMAVPLTDPDSPNLEELNRIISYVLITGATRRVHMDPVSSMVATAMGHQDLTLWDFADENVHRNLFVDDAGQVSLSARHLTGHPYGPLGELNLEDMERGASYQRLSSYAEELFVSRSECATCRAYPLCGGWLRYVDRGYDCEVWHLVLTALLEAVGDTERTRKLARHR